MFISSAPTLQQEKSPLPDNHHQTILDGICSDFELGYVDPINTLSRLHRAGLLARPAELASIFVAGIRARAAHGSPPEPPTAPEATRAASPAQELLDAVAGARLSRGRVA